MLEEGVVGLSKANSQQLSDHTSRPSSGPSSILMRHGLTLALGRIGIGPRRSQRPGRWS